MLEKGGEAERINLRSILYENYKYCKVVNSPKVKSLTEFTVENESKICIK